MKVSFLYNAQLHQIPHSLPIALELAAHHPDIEVEIAVVSARHLDFATRLAASYGNGAPLRFVQLRRSWLGSLRAHWRGELAPNKKWTLRRNLPYFDGCDAVITPERTSLLLRRLRPQSSTQLIYTGHGAGDRAVGFADDLHQFDYVLFAGRKLEARLMAKQLIRPGHYCSGVYAKFDWTRACARPKWFDNERPTVLYNPHFEPGLSSWPDAGWKVLDYFAQSTEFNLIFAPHIRLFEPPSARAYRRFAAYQQLPHLRIDLGSESSLDMSYTRAADLYLGDVSSQTAEFLAQPRPCLFLNPKRVAWAGDANYRSWTLGPVIDDVALLDTGLRTAIRSHGEYVDLQRDYFEDSFGDAAREPTARRGADAIAGFLQQTAAQRATNPRIGKTGFAGGRALALVGGVIGGLLATQD